MLTRVSDAASGCCSQVYLYAPRSRQYRNLLGDRPLTSLEEIRPGCGPLVAFAAALNHLPAVDWILLLACDLPKLDAAILGDRAAQLPQLLPHTLAWVPRYKGSWEPLCAFYRPALKFPLDAFIAAGGRSFQAFLSHLPAQPFTPTAAESRMLFNCNTPEDLSG